MRMGLSMAAVLCLAVGNLPAQVQRTNVDIKAPDGTLLKGTHHSPARHGPAILLLHQCNMDRRAWDVLTGDLTRTGFHVLTFDLPGFGETRGAFQVDFRNEAEAAYAFLLSQKGVGKNRVAVGGASCGVDLTGDLALRHSEIKTLMLMSGYVTGPAMSNIAAKPSIAVFRIVAENDPEGAGGIKNAVRVVEPALDVEGLPRKRTRRPAVQRAPGSQAPSSGGFTRNYGRPVDLQEER